jgi:hypothetical protein
LSFQVGCRRKWPFSRETRTLRAPKPFNVGWQDEFVKSSPKMSPRPIFAKINALTKQLNKVARKSGATSVIFL